MTVSVVMSTKLPFRVFQLASNMLHLLIDQIDGQLVDHTEIVIIMYCSYLLVLKVL